MVQFMLAMGIEAKLFNHDSVIVGNNADVIIIDDLDFSDLEARVIATFGLPTRVGRQRKDNDLYSIQQEYIKRKRAEELKWQPTKAAIKSRQIRQRQKRK